MKFLYFIFLVTFRNVISTILIQTFEQTCINIKKNQDYDNLN